VCAVSKNKFLIKLQNITGANASELAVALILLIGLSAGYLLDGFASEKQVSGNPEYSYFAILDSIAVSQQKEYTGIPDEDTIAIPKIANQSKEKITKNNEIIKEKRTIGKINLNTASKLELMELPGVGEKTAIKILQYRENQKFNSIEEIQNIKGIGPKKFENMKNYLQV
jgi:comEA protein